MNLFRLKMFLGLFFTSVVQAFGSISDYNPPEILARANISDGYNIPAMSFLNNTSPVINNRGDVAFKIMAVEGINNQALWVKRAQERAGKIVYMAPELRFLTDPSLSDAGKIAFNLFDEGVTDGLFLYDTESSDVTQVLSPDNLPIQFYTYPQVLNNNHIFFRATDDDNNRIFYQFTGSKLNKILSEGESSLGNSWSYLFRPSVNEAGQIAFKARLGEKGQWDESNPDSILVLTAGAVTTIARDMDSDPHSKYLSFGNSVSLSKHALVAFMGVLADSKKAIVVSKDNVLTNIAIEGQNDISEIEMFAPKINDQGLVLFRAKDMSGKRGLYLADTTTVTRLVGEGSEIETDLGPGTILFNPNYPGLGGEVDMNDQGEIVFYCLIVSAEGKELGAAVYKMTPKK